MSKFTKEERIDVLEFIIKKYESELVKLTEEYNLNKDYYSDYDKEYQLHLIKLEKNIIAIKKKQLEDYKNA